MLPDEPGTALEAYRAAGLEVVTIPLGRIRRTPRQNLHFARRFPGDIHRIARVVNDRKIDAVVIAGLDTPHAAFAGRMARRSVIWQINGTQTPMSYRRAMVPIASKVADVIMPTGKTMIGEFPGIEKLGERCLPFLSPIDPEIFKPDAARRAWARAELGLEPDVVVIGMVANFNPQKGHETFIEAAAALRARVKDVRFVLLGAHYAHHAEFERRLWARAAALGLERGRDVLTIDPGRDVLRLEPAFDVAWLASGPRSEGVPTALIEALALGLPAVVTAVGGVRDIVEDGVNGFVVPPLQPVELALATVPLVLDEGLRTRMGRESRNIAVERCSVEVCAETHLKAFDLAAAHAAGRRRSTRRVG
jgi:glycosyltransferase involved in cell wall biosynthesis